MIMRHLLAGLLIGASFASPSAAIGDLASFERIHTECVEVGGISFGARGRWADCRVSKGRWFSTIGHLDFYQAQYCLGNGGESCEQRAMLLFANRAYTPVAKMLLGRLDPGDVVYADPLVQATAHGQILTLAVQRAGSTLEQRYYRWHEDNWQAIDTAAWERQLAGRLPAGVFVRGGMRPDFENMRLQADLVRRHDGASGSADIELGMVKTQLGVKSVKLILPGS